MKPIKWFVVQLSALLILACAISWYDEFTSLEMAIFLIAWSSWLPLTCGAILLLLSNFRSLLAYSVAGTFTFTYIASAYPLYSIYEIAWADGIMQESFIAAVIFPMWFFLSAPIGALTGVALWHNLRDKSINQP